MGIKIGQNDVNFPYNKIYIGSNLVYELNTIITKKWVLKTGSYLPTFIAGDFDENNCASRDGVIITYGNASNTASTFTDAHLAFDKDTGTCCDVRHAGSQTEDGWFTIDFGKEIIPTRVTLTVANDANETGEPYSILGSVDNINWDTLWSVAFKSESIFKHTFDISLNEGLTPYRYLRHVWDNAKSAVLDHPDLYDLQILEWYEEEEEA